MKKIFLQKIEQYGTICYIGKIDPRDLIRVAAKIGMGEVQDAQRPLNEKRVKEIASYIGKEKGILPNTLTIATVDSKYEIQRDSSCGLYYINFPETDIEFKEHENTIEVMDGQHRLYSFLENLRQISDNDHYEIGFTMYIRPTLEDKRRIFISCNEKQEKVSGNLLMWFKEKLNMISNEEKTYYGIVSKLNNEYPLKGHIIMSAERVRNGVKAKEVMAAIKQAKILDLTINGIRISDDIAVKIICTYLTSWENVVDFKFASSVAKNAGAAIKMAGLKYMLLLLPSIWDRAITMRMKFDEDFVKTTLIKFITSLGIVRNEFFTCDANKMKFRDRTVIDAFANESIIIIKALDAGSFNPLG